jgi:hypothetical protein
VIINFDVLYEIDEQEAAHALSLNSYQMDGTGDADHHHWVVLGRRKSELRN